MVSVPLIPAQHFTLRIIAIFPKKSCRRLPQKSGVFSIPPIIIYLMPRQIIMQRDYKIQRNVATIRSAAGRNTKQRILIVPTATKHALVTPIKTSDTSHQNKPITIALQVVKMYVCFLNTVMTISIFREYFLAIP